MNADPHQITEATMKGQMTAVSIRLRTRARRSADESWLISVADLLGETSEQIVDDGDGEYHNDCGNDLGDCSCAHMMSAINITRRYLAVGAPSVNLAGRGVVCENTRDHHLVSSCWCGYVGSDARVHRLAVAPLGGSAWGTYCLVCSEDVGDYADCRFVDVGTTPTTLVDSAWLRDQFRGLLDPDTTVEAFLTRLEELARSMSGAA